MIKRLEKGRWAAHFHGSFFIIRKVETGGYSVGERSWRKRFQKQIDYRLSLNGKLVDSALSFKRIKALANHWGKKFLSP